MPSLSTPGKRRKFSNIRQFWEEKESKVNWGESEILPHNVPTENVTPIMSLEPQPNYPSSTNPGQEELIADQWDQLSQTEPNTP